MTDGKIDRDISSLLSLSFNIYCIKALKIPLSWSISNANNVVLVAQSCLFVTPWTVARQVPLSMGFSGQEYWSGLPCLPPGDLPKAGIKPTVSYVSCIGRWVLYH